MNKIEKIKALYSAPYDVKKVTQFKEIMMESVDSFLEVIAHIDVFKRSSDEFQIITSYHIESYRHDQKYKDMYEAVGEETLREQPERNSGEKNSGGVKGGWFCY